VALDLFEQGCGSSDLKNFPECLTKLTNALLRQQRHLAQIAAKEIKIAVKPGSAKCVECGQSVKQSAESVP